MATVKDKVGQSTLDYINQSQYFPTWSSGTPAIQLTLTAIGNTTLVVKNQLLINGTSGADVLAITDNNGLTSINGAAGNDVIVLNSSVSAAQGGAGKDFIMSIGDINVLDGGADSDMLVAVGSANFMLGGAGNDYLISIAGSCGGNILVGGAGNDTMDALKDFYSVFNFSGKYASYAGGITRDASVDGKYKIVGPDGTDTIFAHRSAALVFDNKIVQIKDLFPDRAPIAVNDVNSTLKEDTVLTTTGNVLTNDRDPDVDPLFVKSVNGTAVPSTPAGLLITNTWGTLNVKQDGSYSFTLNNATAQQLALNAVHTETFSYIAGSTYVGVGSSPSLSSNTVTLTINITGVNDAPVAVNDTIAAPVPNNAPYIISAATLLSNDTDVDQGDLALLKINSVTSSAATHGTVTLLPNGDVLFTPTSGYSGPASFTYTVTDTRPGGISGPATVNLTVASTNQAPTANNDSFSTTDVVNNAPIALGNVLTNDTDPNLPADTKAVFSANFVNFTLSGTNLSGLGTTAIGSLTVTPIAPVGAEKAHFILTPTGVLANDVTLGGTEVVAELIIMADGTVNLIKNTAFDFLPAGVDLTLHFTYIMEDAALAQSNTANLDIVVTNTDNNDVFVGPNLSTGDLTLSGGIGNDVMYGGTNSGAGTYVISGESGNNILYGGTNSSNGGYSLSAVLSTGNNTLMGGANNSAGLYELVAINSSGTNTLMGGTNNGGFYNVTAIFATGNNTLNGGTNNNGPYNVSANNSSGDNTLTGSSNNNGSYNVSANNSSGDNTLTGGANSGFLYTVSTNNATGTNTLTGGANNSATGNYFITGGLGDDTITAGMNSNSEGGSYTIFGNAGADTITGAGPTGGNTAIYSNNLTPLITSFFFATTPLSTVSDVAMAALDVTAAAASLGSLLNYNLFLTAGFINVDALVGTDGHDKITADTTLQNGNGSSVQFINFGGTTYNLWNGRIDEDNGGGEYALPSSGNTLFVGGDNANYLYTIETSGTGNTGNYIVIGGTNSGTSFTNYNIEVGGSGNSILIGGANSENGEYALNAQESTGNNILVQGTNELSYHLYGGSGNDLFLAGNNTGLTDYYGNGGLDTLSFINITGGIGVTLDLGILLVSQSTGGDGVIFLIDTFEILQGSNFGDTLSYTQSHSGGALGGSINISSESIYGMGGNDVLTISGMVGSPGVTRGPVGNEASSGNSTNAQVTLANNILNVGAGTGGQNISVMGTAYGASATNTFGNHAMFGFTAISADVGISGNTLVSESTTTSDTRLIQAVAQGGNEGSTAWDGSSVNTDANLADGLGSVAISAKASIDNNHLSGGGGGAQIFILTDALGGGILGTFGLYANHAINGGEATSALSTVHDNTFDGYGALSKTDVMFIQATAQGGSALAPGFTSNVSGFDGHGGGTAISADVNIHDNTMTEHGAANAFFSIFVAATGGSGQHYANYAYDGGGMVISARVTVDSNTLTGNLGDDNLSINASANTGSANNGIHAGFDSTAIGSQVIITDNTLDGGSGNDNLQLILNTLTTSDGGGGGTVILADINVSGNTLNGGADDDRLSFLINSADLTHTVVEDNQLLGGLGNDVLIFNNAALLGNSNVLDGGDGFDTLTQQITNGNLNLIPIAGNVVQNIEKVDLTGWGTNTLMVNATTPGNLNTSDSLYVTGDTGDTVSLGGGFVYQDTVAGNGPDAGILFDHYTFILSVDIYVQQGVTVI